MKKEEGNHNGSLLRYPSPVFNRADAPKNGMKEMQKLIDAVFWVGEKKRGDAETCHKDVYTIVPSQLGVPLGI